MPAATGIRLTRSPLRFPCASNTSSFALSARPKKSTLASNLPPHRFACWMLPNAMTPPYSSASCRFRFRKLKSRMLRPPIGSGIVERRIDVGAQDERAGRRRHLIADDARLALLHEISDALVGVAVHDPVARPRGAPLAVEVGRVQHDIGQVHLALDQHVAAGDQEDLLADQAIEQPDRPAVDARRPARTPASRRSRRPDRSASSRPPEP